MPVFVSITKRFEKKLEKNMIEKFIVKHIKTGKEYKLNIQLVTLWQ